MRRRSLLVSAGAFAAAAGARGRERLSISFWHGMTGALGDEVQRVCAAFNASQTEIQVEPLYKGAYVEVFITTIAAWRAGQPPHLSQIHDIGTGTMQAATTGPVKPAWELYQESGIPFDAGAYIPAARGYYGTVDGRMLSVPFNVSTGLMWVNRDAFGRAGLDPDDSPLTWDDVVRVARRLKSTGAAELAMTTASPSWIHFEMFSAIHDLPFASGSNGFDGLEVELKLNSPAHVHNLERLIGLHREGLFNLNGRDRAGDPIFPTGRAGLTFSSCSNRGQYARLAKFDWMACFLPYDPAVISKAINSSIGGGSLWTFRAEGRTRSEYAACARFLSFIGTPEMDTRWHQHTGYVPATLEGYRRSRDQGYYGRNRGTDLPIEQLLRTESTANSRGIRLGRMPQIRDILEEEIELSMGGEKGAKPALESAVARGNHVLREFERTARP
jgi:sn-glycerol 3-phosphate transport system substrate-binding protein